MNAPTDPEQRLTEGLHRLARRADLPATSGPAADGLAAVHRRIARRARTRRLSIAAAVVAVVALAAATVNLGLGGHDDGANVVSTPGTSTIPMPQLGLPPEQGDTAVMAYTPGRSVTVAVDLTHGTLVNGSLQLIVTDRSVDEVATGIEPGVVGRPVTVRGQAGLGFDRQVSTSSTGRLDTPCVVWPAVSKVVGVLCADAYPVADMSVEDLEGLAGDLVELDDARWWSLLNTSLASGLPNTPMTDPAVRPWLGLVGTLGAGEVDSMTPGLVLRQVLLVPGFPDGTFELLQVRGDTVDPSLFNGTDPNDVDVRGERGVVQDITTSSGLRHELIWAGDGSNFLRYTDAATAQDAVAVADRLVRLDDDQWQALLFPAEIHPQLVPMWRPLEVPSGGQGTVQGQGQELPPTTGG